MGQRPRSLLECDANIEVSVIYIAPVVKNKKEGDRYIERKQSNGRKKSRVKESEKERKKKKVKENRKKVKYNKVEENKKRKKNHKVKENIKESETI